MFSDNGFCFVMEYLTETIFFVPFVIRLLHRKNTVDAAAQIGQVGFIAAS
jgi:hypothetical protein